MPARAMHLVSLFVSASLAGGSGCEGAYEPAVEVPDELVAPRGCRIEGPGLLWPIACPTSEPCWHRIGEPDLDGDGIGFDCEPAGYAGHRGTDISVSEEAMREGIIVVAAAAGEVIHVRDDRHDRCDLDPEHEDCIDAPPGWAEPGQAYGRKSCTRSRPELCDPDSDRTSCMRCFFGGNVVVLRHFEGAPAFGTYYGHLRRGSVMVKVGEIVGAGRPIAMVGSSGTSGGPHLHFEAWEGWKAPIDPWSGLCSTEDRERSLFISDPPWCAAEGLAP